MLHEPLKERALHRWPGILAAIGIPAKALSNRHGPCPMCGGKDRFRFDNKDGRGTWICSQCGAGDGIELVKQFNKIDFKEAARLIEHHIGAAPVVVRGPQRVIVDGAVRDEMNALWKRSKPIQPGDHAGRYLQARTGIETYPDCLRFAADERYAEQGQKPTWHPLMLAKVEPSDEAIAQGERPALHRTYLSTDASKADVPSPRKMLGTMPTGAAVRLMPHDEVLGIAEGIETALSASAIFGFPAWAALTAGLLQDWLPPANVKTVFVFGDNDVSFTGQAAAYALAQKLRTKGLTVTVEIPMMSGEDWNDVHRKRSLAK